MGLSEITAPTGTVITLSEARQHLRLDIADDDIYIIGLIKTATKYAEHFINRQLLEATWEYTFDKFPVIRTERIELPRPPLKSITSIKYYDLDGVEQTLSSATYSADTRIDPGTVYLAYNQTWPNVRNIPNAITVRFVCGYGTAADVPEGIKSAIKLLIAWLYEQREPVVIGTSAQALPFSMESLLYQYQVPCAP